MSTVESTARNPLVCGVEITHPDRVVDVATGLTKRGLAEYYRAVSSRMLPHVVGRPLAVVRCPDGASAQCFFQKHRTTGMPEAILESRVGRHAVLHVEDVTGVLELVQFGVVEFHAWGAPLSDVHRPDRVVIDLDPDPELEFATTIDAAFEVRDLLTDLGLSSFVRTTGGKGLHVLAPIVPSRDFGSARELLRAVADRLERRAPERYTALASKRVRPGKIFVDYLRNGEGATSIAPYSARARPGSPVSFPVSWEALPTVDPLAFAVSTVPGLLETESEDPWAAFFTTRQELPNEGPRRPDEAQQREGASSGNSEKASHRKNEIRKEGGQEGRTRHARAKARHAPLR